VWVVASDPAENKNKTLEKLWGGKEGCQAGFSNEVVWGREIGSAGKFAKKGTIESPPVRSKQPGEIRGQK